MSAEELAAWREMNLRVLGGHKATRPCVDCPRAFAAEVGDCCNGRPESKGGRLKGDGRGRIYGKSAVVDNTTDTATRAGDTRGNHMEHPR